MIEKLPTQGGHSGHRATSTEHRLLQSSQKGPSSIRVAQFELEGIPPIRQAVEAALALERTRALSRGDPVEQRVGHRHRRD
jgi:hypothetical protein